MLGSDRQGFASRRHERDVREPAWTLGLGVHKFILGMTGTGIIQIVITLLTCGTIGPIIGLIEGIIYLTKTDQEFHEIYEVGKKAWF